MTDTLPSPDRAHQRLEVLHGLKRLMRCRDPHRNLTPFSDRQVVCYDTAVGDLDVPEIHAEPRRLIEEAVREVQAQQQARVILLAGNPGMGKSHLVNHFRRPEVAGQLGYVLVSPTNHWDVKDFEDRLLDSLITALVGPRPGAPDLLGKRVEAVAFTVLGQLLGRPGAGRYFRGPEEGLFRRLLSRLRKPDQGQIAKRVATRDGTIFREMDFDRFSDYACERVLSAPGDPLHRYVLRVLLHYVFPEERELIVHWLRGRATGGHFAKKLRVEEELDKSYKRMDAVRLLMSLFGREVTERLAGQADGLREPGVFLLAFDQMEGRNELFESDADWFRFFAHLAELYNTLPNVMVLFPMTLHLRDRLHGRMERQFQDRIRRDERFVLRYIEPSEVLALYRRRLDGWVGAGEHSLREKMQAAGEDYAPLSREQVLELATNRTLRDALGGIDGEFRRVLNETATDVPVDFVIAQREVQKGLSADPFDATGGHLATIEELLSRLGESLAAAHGLRLEPPSWVENDVLKALELRFLAAEGEEWVRVYLSRLPYQYNQRLSLSLDLLRNRHTNRNFLWVVRARPISAESFADRPEQAFFRLLLPEAEVALKAISHVATLCGGYRREEWVQGFDFLLGEFRKTYLGEIFAHAQQALRALAAGAAEAPVDGATQEAQP